MDAKLILLRRDDEVEEVALDKFTNMNLSYVKYVLIPIEMDPMGVTQYISMNAGDVFQNIEDCEITFQMKLESWYDGDTDPLFMAPITKHPKDIIEYYGILHSLDNNSTLFDIMNDRGANMTDGYLIMDICSIKVDVIADGKKYFYEHKTNYDLECKGKFLVSDQIRCELSKLGIYPSTETMKQDNGATRIWIDLDTNRWLVPDDNVPECDEGVYTLYLPNRSIVLIALKEFLLFNGLIRLGGEPGKIEMVSHVVPNMDSSYLTDIYTGIDVVGRYPTDPNVLQIFYYSLYCVEDLIGFILGIRYIFTSIIIAERALGFIEEKNTQTDPSKYSCSMKMTCIPMHMPTFEFQYSDWEMKDYSPFMKFMVSFQEYINMMGA